MTNVNSIAHEFTFGVEIETHVSLDTIGREGLIIGAYGSPGCQVPYLPPRWVAKRDSSIDAPRISMCYFVLGWGRYGRR